MTAPTATEPTRVGDPTADGPRSRLLSRPGRLRLSPRTACSTARSTRRRSRTGTAFVASGLADRLIAARAGSSATNRRHLTAAATPDARAVIRPDEIEFISYPFEWTFSELKDAALLTLDVELEALSAGWTLKDATAYNVQFRDARPDADRLALVRAARGRGSVGRLPPVLRAFPGAADAHGLRRDIRLSALSCEPTPTASRSTSPRAWCRGGPGWTSGCCRTSTCTPTPSVRHAGDEDDGAAAKRARISRSRSSSR